MGRGPHHRALRHSWGSKKSIALFDHGNIATLQNSSLLFRMSSIRSAIRIQGRQYTILWRRMLAFLAITLRMALDLRERSQFVQWICAEKCDV